MHTHSRGPSHHRLCLPCPGSGSLQGLKGLGFRVWGFGFKILLSNHFLNYVMWTCGWFRNVAEGLEFGQQRQPGTAREECFMHICICLLLLFVYSFIHF